MTTCCPLTPFPWRIPHPNTPFYSRYIIIHTHGSFTIPVEPFSKDTPENEDMGLMKGARYDYVP